mgnify:CR=1 FL=1
MSRGKKVGKNRYHPRKAPFIVIVIFLLIGMAGIYTGEPQRVWEQAVRVCLSCIGIG